MSDHSGGQAYLAGERQRDQAHHHRYREEQVLTDDPAGPSTEPNGVTDLVEILSHDHYVGGLQSDVRSGRTQRDPHIGHGECRGVVHAVSDHGDRSVLLPELLEYLGFSIGQELSVDVIDIEIRRDGFRGAPVVAREHREMPDSLSTQVCEHVLESRPRRISDPQHGLELPVEANIYGRRARGPVFSDRFQPPPKRWGIASGRHPRGSPHSNARALDDRLDPLPRS